MIVEIRKSLTGTEYWDTDAKKTLFVPKGKKPDFEVTKDPVSMIGGVDLASGKDMTVVDGINLLGLNAEQMIAIAKEHGIDVPGNMKKVETIQKYIVDALNATDEE